MCVGVWGCEGACGFVGVGMGLSETSEPCSLAVTVVCRKQVCKLVCVSAVQCPGARPGQSVSLSAHVFSQAVLLHMHRTAPEDSTQPKPRECLCVELEMGQRLHTYTHRLLA